MGVPCLFAVLSVSLVPTEVSSQIVIILKLQNFENQAVIALVVIVIFFCALLVIPPQHR